MHQRDVAISVDRARAKGRQPLPDLQTGHGRHQGHQGHEAAEPAHLLDVDVDDGQAFGLGAGHFADILRFNGLCVGVCVRGTYAENEISKIFGSPAPQTPMTTKSSPAAWPGTGLN